MSTATESPSLPIRVAKNVTTHPLAPLDANEIQKAVSSIRGLWPDGTDLHFKSISLHEPAKADVVPYIESIDNGQAPNKIDRKVMVTYYIRKTVCQQRACAAHCLLRSDYQYRTNCTKLL